MKKSRHINLKECYDILQLDKDANLEDVKKAYRKRAFELHPDLNPHTPDAGYQFQRLNEAYVALSQVLQTEEATQKQASTSEKKEHRKDAEHAKKHEDAAQKSAAQREAEKKKQKSASAAYEKEYEKEDVLRDLLKDSFARRVFEDIYSEVNKQSQDENPQTSSRASAVHTPKAPPPPTTATQATRVDVDSGPKPFNGFANKVKGWFLQQIDAKQVIKMSTATLFPGARIRLQIRQGLSEELKTFEITLPKDFAVGKPMRLRGLGKKVGKWQGDLYITIENI